MLSLMENCFEDDDRRQSSIQKRASDYICIWIIFLGNAALREANEIENDQEMKLKIQMKMLMQMKMKIIGKCK
jgi:hypothetical protein